MLFSQNRVLCVFLVALDFSFFFFFFYYLNSLYPPKAIQFFINKNTDFFQLFSLMNSRDFLWIQNLLPEANSLIFVLSREYCVCFFKASTTSLTNSVFGNGGKEEKRRKKDWRNFLSTVWLYKREEKRMEEISYPLFGCTREKKNGWGGMIFFTWDPLFRYQPNLGGNRRKGDHRFYGALHFIL